MFVGAAVAIVAAFAPPTTAVVVSVASATASAVFIRRCGGLAPAPALVGGIAVAVLERGWCLLCALLFFSQRTTASVAISAVAA